MPYFECLHCGTVAPVDATPPKCAQCGHGTGIIYQNEPPAARKAAETQKKQEPGEPGLGSTTASAPSSA
jgi:ribosomal protein L34E